MGFATVLLQARVLQPLKSDATAFAGWGLAHATIDDVPSSTTLANPRVGLLFGSSERGWVEMSVDLPLMSELGDEDYATGVGILTDFERFEQYAEDVVTIHVGGVMPRLLTTATGSAGARLEGIVPAPTDGGDTELLARYAIFGSVLAGRAEMSAEFSGASWLSDVGGDRTYTSLTLGAGLPDVRARPALYVRLPLDEDMRRTVGAVVGLRVTL